MPSQPENGIIEVPQSIPAMPQIVLAAVEIVPVADEWEDLDIYQGTDEREPALHSAAFCGKNPENFHITRE